LRLQHIGFIFQSFPAKTFTGFEVVSVLCTMGRVPKSELNLTQDEHIDRQAQVETMCNPIMEDNGA